MFRNVSKSGHWLTVEVVGKAKGLNPMGIGATVRVYKAGQAGKKSALLDRYDITMGSGYCTGNEATAPIGLGKVAKCDVVVTWGKRVKTVKDVKADQFLKITFTE